MAERQNQNIRANLSAMQEIATALAPDDFASLERAAVRIGFSEERAKSASKMGKGAAGFPDQAFTSLRSADRIAVAARQRSREQVLAPALEASR